MDSTRTEPLMGAMRRLRVTGAYSDMSIKCGEHEFKVHKAIICPRSGFFEAMFRNNMQETLTSQVDLSEHDLQTVTLLVDFFYHLDYEPPPPPPPAPRPEEHALPEPVPESPAEPPAEPPVTEAPEPVTEEPVTETPVPEPLQDRYPWEPVREEPPSEVPANEDGRHTASSWMKKPKKKKKRVAKPNLLDHCRVYALAEMFQVEDLKVLAASKFQKEAMVHWNHPDFLEAVQVVYLTSVRTDRLLRDIVVETMKSRKSLLDNEAFREVVAELDLAFELLMAVHKSGIWADNPW